MARRDRASAAVATAAAGLAAVQALPLAAVVSGFGVQRALGRAAVTALPLPSTWWGHTRVR